MSAPINLCAVLAADYQPDDSYRKAMEAADAALAALPPEMWGMVFQAATSLAFSEALFQGLHGPIGKTTEGTK